MHRKLATWDSGRAFLPWLAAIARYRWIDMLRRQRDEAELGDNDAAVGAEDEAVHARLSIDHLLTLLPPKQAQAITLVKIEGARSEEHTSELQSLMRNSYAVFCLKKKKRKTTPI